MPEQAAPMIEVNVEVPDEIRIAALPGEIFAETGLSVRTGLDGRPTGGGTIAVAYADGCPGYVPPLTEIPHGGYEVSEAHRYFATPGPFAPGTAERLAEGAGLAPIPMDRIRL